MSKIFESLKRVQGALSGVDLTALTAEGGREPADNSANEARTVLNGEAEKLERACSTAADLWQLAQVTPLRIEAGGPLLPFDGTSRHASEQYRILRTRITQHPLQPKTIVISSGGSDDGKSTTAINLAAAFALKSEGRILLMDGDFRRGSIASQLGLPKGPGLTEVLAGACLADEALLRAEQIPNLYVFPAGRAVANPSELLDSPAWISILNRCRKSFKYVFVDSPPIGAVADYDVIQASCDGVVMIARQDHTKRTLCLEAVRAVPKQKLIGVVLNSVASWPFQSANTYTSYYNT